METSQLDKARTSFLHSPFSMLSAWKFAHSSPLLG